MDKFVKVLCVLGAGILMTVGFGMVILILCPGVSIFGVRYVGFAQEDVKYTKEIVDLGTDVEIESNALGMEISFSSTRTTANVDISQSFIGFTTKKMGEEYYTITKENGKTKIVFLDVPTVAFGTNRDSSAIKVVLPNSLNSLSVTSNSSDISLSGATINVKTVQLYTDGVVNVNSTVGASVFEVHNAKLNVNGKLGDGTTLKVDTYKAVNVNKISNANVEISARGATVNAVSCRSLKIKTTTGKVMMTEGVISGACEIETVSGDIKLGSVNGKLNINTKYGNVVADYVKNGDILANAGDVKIRSVDNVAIECTSGDIEIISVLQKANLVTGSGTVKLSNATEKSSIKNINVETYSGDVVAFNITGEKAKIETINGKITVNNSKTDKLVLASEKADIVASGISCVSSQISTNGKIIIGYVNNFEQANIYGGDGAVTVNLADNIECNIVASTDSSRAHISVDGYTVSGVSYSNNVSGASSSLKVKTGRGSVKIG